MRSADRNLTAGRQRGWLPATLWRRAASASHRLLVLDYDGTLAPFNSVREEARPLTGIPGLLGQIASGGRTEVAVVSGRPIMEIERLMAVPLIHYVGEHGWETQRVGQAPARHELPEDVTEALRSAEETAAFAGLATCLERKRTALVLHTRGLAARVAEHRERECQGLWEPATARARLLLRKTEGGLELRAAARNKGTAVRELMAACPSGTLPVYVGDDETDEDAFREVLHDGFGIRVGLAERPSFATGRLATCSAVRRFLERWLLEIEAFLGPREMP